MSDHLSQYNHMTAEELAAVLRADLTVGGENALEGETLLYVIQRYAEQAEKPPKTAHASFETFRLTYLSDCENSASAEEKG